MTTVSYLAGIAAPYVASSFCRCYVTSGNFFEIGWFRFEKIEAAVFALRCMTATLNKKPYPTETGINYVNEKAY